MDDIDWKEHAEGGWRLVEQYRGQVDALQAYNQTRTDELAALVRQCAELQAELAALRQQIAEARPVGEVSESAWDKGVLYKDLKPGQLPYLHPPLRQPDTEVLDAMKQAVVALDYCDAETSSAFRVKTRASTDLRAAINKLENKNDQG